MSDTVIELSNVSMEFSLSNDRIMSLKQFVTSTLRGKLRFEKFVALHDISFTVNKGELLGFIGNNGSGKSTLLKLISGIMKPSSGVVVTHGVIAPMLELGSGFDFELTGRENIYLNGAILGYSKEFLDSKFQDILDFSELGQFIDVPIRTYSSGMMTRLAFSVATMVQPDILIVDEILSVGDDSFQRKSHGRMMELMSGGTTVLFVSHSMEQIKDICHRAIWLDEGTIRMIGESSEVCDGYSKHFKA